MRALLRMAAVALVAAMLSGAGAARAQDATPAAPGRCQVTVRDAVTGAPIPGAQVEVVQEFGMTAAKDLEHGLALPPRWGRDDEDPATTGSDGVAEVAWRESHAVFVRAKGFASCCVRLPDAAGVPLECRLVKGGELRFRLVPTPNLEHVSVGLQQLGLTKKRRFDLSFPERLVVDPNGTCVCEALPAAYYVLIVRDGPSPYEGSVLAAQTFRIEADATTTLEIATKPPAKREGRTVRVRAPEAWGALEACEGIIWDGTSDAKRVRAEWSEARVASFELYGLEEGTHAFLIPALGWLGEVTITESERVADLALSEPVDMRLRIRQEGSDRPVVTAEVHWREAGTPLEMWDYLLPDVPAMAFADADGLVSLRIAECPARLIVRARGHVEQRIAVPSPAALASSVRDVRLARAGELRLLVLEDGRPRPGRMRAYLEPKISIPPNLKEEEVENYLRKAYEERPSKEADSERARFRFGELSPGVYRLSVVTDTTSNETLFEDEIEIVAGETTERVIEL